MSAQKGVYVQASGLPSFDALIELRAATSRLDYIARLTVFLASKLLRSGPEARMWSAMVASPHRCCDCEHSKNVEH